MGQSRDVAARIEDYGMVGDLQTAALISREGSVDWLCFPRFDSGACFAALLGDEENGRWVLAPTDEDRDVSRRYRPDTLILETEWQTTTGRVRVTDFMPPRGETPDLVRIVEGIDGEVEMFTEIVIRFDYGSIVPWVRRVGDNERVAVAGPDAVVLATPVDVHGEDYRTRATFTVSADERVPFVLTWYPSHRETPQSIDAERALDDTQAFWSGWANKCEFEGEHHDEVHQSLLVLKALTYEPTGGIVAAPTTSLPEHIGGIRNWDYRFCWLRDATLTLLALLQAGYVEEADEWRKWLLRAAAGVPSDLQIMYGVAGERRLTELELDWLDGYEKSAPVRIGNGASEQIQLDVYGEVLDALYQGRKHGMTVHPSSWSVQKVILRHLERVWREPDHGIWEIRGPKRHFTHSKVMAWLAFDRAVCSVEEQGLDGPVERWREVRDEIHAEVCKRGFDEARGTFTQTYEDGKLDASLLQIPLVGFLPVSDERVVGTVDAVARELMYEGFLLRYRTDDEGTVDGLPAGEGVFLPCSFWLADCWELLGRHDEAHALFEKLLSLRNDLGLLSEEYDPVARRMLGNFPQAFTHLALVNTAFTLAKEHPPVVHRHAR
jgi:GH15 family glucan-1,4-alpha-glucosidase